MSRRRLRSGSWLRRRRRSRLAVADPRSTGPDRPAGMVGPLLGPHILERSDGTLRSVQSARPTPGQRRDIRYRMAKLGVLVQQQPHHRERSDSSTASSASGSWSSWTASRTTAMPTADRHRTRCSPRSATACSGSWPSNGRRVMARGRGRCPRCDQPGDHLARHAEQLRKRRRSRVRGPETRGIRTEFRRRNSSPNTPAQTASGELAERAGLRGDAAVRVKAACGVRHQGRPSAPPSPRRTSSISRCGKDGNVDAGCFVRSDRKFIRLRAFIVTYIEE